MSYTCRNAERLYCAVEAGNRSQVLPGWQLASEAEKPITPARLMKSVVPLDRESGGIDARGVVYCGGIDRPW